MACPSVHLNLNTIPPGPAHQEINLFLNHLLKINFYAASYRDPFFVHPSVNPNAVLCSPPLNGDNYASWKIGMMRALRLKNKIGFIDGSISKPTDSAKLGEWMRAYGLVIGWIHAAILHSVKDSVSYAPTVFLLWKDLENIHVESCDPKLYQLKQQLAFIKQDGSSVMVFYGRLRAIWDEMDTIRPLSTCNAKDAIDHLNPDTTMEFLQCLHDRYAGLRSNILQRIEFPPLLTIYNLV
ncbi:uncharacterized protein LOC113315421 [Papaver somniferum]|uniref:uncharacterized protein LOC113315421 n=1 Tax=Papaver somniferum TaxID=3469 RepID=UPI000E6FA68E|nr:uncharacterized protein LOC113315421 [Papaver somniferum]